MKDKTDDKKSTSEKVKTKSEKGSDPKSEKESSDKNKNNSVLKSFSDKNGMLCPKSVRNQMKKNKDNSEKSDGSKGEDAIKMKIKDLNSNLLIKKPISNISEIKTVEIIKINKEKVNLSVDFVKSTKCKPSLIYSSNPVLNEINHNGDESDQITKHKKKKKHGKSKVINDSDDGNKDLKNKKSRKSKKKKHKDMSPEDVTVKTEPSTDNVVKEVVTIDSKVTKAPMSLLVSYSSDEEDSHVEPPSIPILIKVPSEIKGEQLNNEENFDKIEIKIKPTKSPGKSAWDSTDSELENESKEIVNIKVKSKSASVASKHSKKSKSSTSKEKSESKSCSKSRSESRSKSGSHSRSRSHSKTSKSHSGSSESRSRSYSRSHSRSYSESSDSRSRSYSRSRSRSRRKSRHRRHHSSSYSRSRSRYRSRSLSRSSSDSRSSRSYSRSRSRYKSGYSNRYRSRSRTRSSRSRSRNSYYRSSYRKHKRSSSPDNFLNPQSRKTKIFNRSTLLGAAPKPVDISKKIDAIKESQKKAAEAHNMSNLNIPLPPEKPKTTPVKPSPGEWCPSMDFGGPVAKKAKKALGNKSITDSKAGEMIDSVTVSEHNLLDSNYIGPQVSSDMAKKLGLDVKASKREKDNNAKKIAENSLNESYLSAALDANHLALQSRAYQHRLNNLQGNSNSEFGGQAAQYFHHLYMSPSSLTNNLTATALAAVASEQLPASVAGSIAQAAVQRIMSSSNLTATYNTPSVVATPTASYQTALQHTIPASCSTLVASTPSGLVPISLLQQGGMPYGINQLVLQHLQQQALGAQFGQTIAIPNQSFLGGINPLLLQASNQQALLQSLGFGGQTQLLASPLNFQHTLLMAAQQQQQQMLAAAQINQAATIQAAQLQAQIQAQARAVSIQSLQQAAQMQSSAQNAAATMAASVAMDQQLLEQVAKTESEHNQLPVLSSGEETKLIMSDYQMPLELAPSAIETNLITSSTTDPNHFDESAVNTTVTTEPSTEATFITEAGDFVSNEISSSSVIKHQAPRIIYNSPAVMASLVTSPVTKP